jgi:prepilin-type N-terminal cleavage/methylation domain-containing protein
VRSPRRSAFTLVELLVVVAIIAALLSTLLPAVQSSREAARQIKCRANLRQVAHAVALYEESRKALPPSGLVAPPDAPSGYALVEPRSGPMLSWIVLVLPYLEAQALYDQFDLGRSVLDQARDPQAVRLPILECPSDDAGSRVFAHSSLTGGRRFAKANVAAYVSPFHVEYQSLFPGALITHRRQTLQKITDGASRTLLLGEIRTHPHPSDQRGAWALPWTGSSVLAFDGHPDYSKAPPGAQFLRLGQAPPRYRFDAISLGLTQRPNNQGPNIDTLYDCPDPSLAQLDQMPCVSVPGQFLYLSAAPRSNHPGGVDLAYLDTHVVFVRDDIDERLMASLVSINDGPSPAEPPH